MSAAITRYNELQRDLDEIKERQAALDNELDMFRRMHSLAHGYLERDANRIRSECYRLLGNIRTRFDDSFPPTGIALPDGLYAEAKP
jgi:FtsZ-binding cell division protein ZapB